MKFKDIQESVIPKEDHVIEMFHKIYQNCQPFLQSIGNRPDRYTLYRGIKNIGPGNVYDESELDVGLLKTRLTDRKPLDTPKEDHDALNRYLIKEYDHPFRNALFATGADHVAVGYGYSADPFAIFPIGKFEILWHPEIGDFYSDFFDLDIYNEYTAEGMPSDTIIEHLFNEYFQPFREDDMESAIDSGHEIMIWVEQFYYIKASLATGFEAWLSK